MASKHVLPPYRAINDGDMSQATVTSSTVDILNMHYIGIHMIWSGTPTGTFAVQISNDNSNWQTMAAPTGPSGSADQNFYDATTAARYIRVKYTKSSGTGTLNVYITGKDS